MMVMSIIPTEQAPTIKVELDAPDIAELFRGKFLETKITLREEREFIQSFEIGCIDEVDVIFGDACCDSAIRIYVSQDAFCECLKTGTAKLVISHDAVVDLVVIIMIKHRGQ